MASSIGPLTIPISARMASKSRWGRVSVPSRSKMTAEVWEFISPSRLGPRRVYTEIVDGVVVTAAPARQFRNAQSIFSGVMGKSLIHTPVALAMA